MAQEKQYDVSKDSANGNMVFKGLVTVDDLSAEPTFDWMKKGIENYQPNAGYVAYLQENLNRFSILLFLGTWCDDSHYWVPKLVKLLLAIQYPNEKLTMYGVDRKKNSKNGENLNYGITNVPTIIFLKDGKEIGRITESAHNGLEADIKEIISNH